MARREFSMRLDYPMGQFAETRDFTCDRCESEGGRWGTEDGEWRQVGGELVCALHEVTGRA